LDSGAPLYGAYTVADKVITFKVEGSTYPNWTGTEQKRNLSAFTPDQLTWSLAAGAMPAGSSRSDNRSRTSWRVRCAT
jgi:hypothetical protein